MKTDKRAKLFKRIAIPISIIFSLSILFLSFYFFGYKHKPFLLHQTDILFEDSNNNVYFSLNGINQIKKYKYDEKNHYETILFEKDGNYLNYVQAASNSTLLFVGLDNGNKTCTSEIRVFDKAFTEIETIAIDNRFSIKGIACDDNYIYCSLQDHNIDRHVLSCINIERKIQYILNENLKETDLYTYENTTLCFNNHFKIKSFNDKRAFIAGYDSKKKVSYLKCDITNVYISSGILTIECGNKKSFFSTKDKYNCLYEKAYLYDNHLIFATYKNVKNLFCGSLANQNGLCNCGMKESFLYDFDIITGDLKIVKKFNSQAFLIDYDLSNYYYYYDGYLYAKEKLIRKCEKVTKPRNERLGCSSPRLSAEPNLYLTYYDGKIYGI